jgi:hypothetical protein
MNFLKRKSVIIGVMFAFVTILTVGQLFAPTEGCTPGFWKRLAKDGPTGWLALTTSSTVPSGYSPDDVLGDVLTFGTQITEPWWTDIQEMTLLDALKFHGGDGVEGAVRIFLRTAVAGLLNAAASHNMMIYYWNWPYYKSLVDGVLTNGTTRDDFLGQAMSIDYWNNLGCPINRWGMRMFPWPGV